MLIRSQIPLFKQVALYSKKHKNDITKTPDLQSKKLLSSPKVLSKFSPISPMFCATCIEFKDIEFKENSIIAKICKDNIKEYEELKNSGEKNKLKSNINNKMIETINNNDQDEFDNVNDNLPSGINTEAIRLPNITKINPSVMQKFKEAKLEVIKSPSCYLKNEHKDSYNNKICEKCENSCDDDSVCHNCTDDNSLIEHSGYLYTKSKKGGLKQQWYILLNQELYCILITI